MLFAVMALDGPDITPEKRKAIHPQHLAHLRSAKDYGIAIVAGGPLVNDAATASIGSMMLLEAADRETIERFNSADPFRKNGVWAKVEIHRFDRKE